MKLLVLSNNPDRASFRQRIGIHIPALREQGVTCEVSRLPGSAWSRRRLYLQARGFDGVLLHRKMLNAWDAFWLRRCGRKVIYDLDDAVMYSDSKPDRVSQVRFRRFGRSAALSRMVIAGNDYLAEHARRYNANVAVLPTGLDLRPYAAAAPRRGDGKQRLVWIGSRSTLKYLADIRAALERIGANHKNVVLRIIADEFLDLDNMEVEKIAWSLESEATELISCDIGLAPLPDNPFTRGKCGFKILQYQAAGLPVIASPVGVNGTYVRDSITGFVPRSPADWVDGLSTLMRDPALRAAMGRAGRREVEKFDVAIIGKQFCDLITECLGRQT